jgi:hypothetical protein
MSDTVVWIHADALSPTNPALIANPDAPALYVFDDAALAKQKISLKRIAFIYECLLEMPVVIRRGDVSAQVLAFAEEHGAARIVTTDSVDPRFKRMYDEISKGLPAGHRLETVAVEPFAAIDSRKLDLRRFTRYWGVVKRLALREK